MKEIIAMHGWAGNGNQWSNWIDFFVSSDWEWQTAERGYGNINPHKPRWLNNTNQKGLKKVAICHSLGIHLIDKEILSSATHIVLINCFTRFIPIGKENRSIRLALKRMMNTINTSSEPSMLRKFHIKSYKPFDISVNLTESKLLYISDSGRLKLKNDLQLLMNSDSLPIGFNPKSKVLVIDSKKDSILASQTKENLFNDLINYLESAPTKINLETEGHAISDFNNIKKIKLWLEFDHAKNLV